MSNRHLEREQLALQLSTWGSLVMAVLGITFGLLTPSEAIMLDGFFNAISFLMAGLSLWVSQQLRQPDSEDFQFGFASFEPLVNLSKGLLISFLSLFALVSAIGALLHGGRTQNPGMAIHYAALAASGCLLIATIQIAIARESGSPMVQVDAKNWFVNGAISLSVGIAFGVVAFIQNTSWSWLVPYADSTIVTALVLLTLPIPFKIVIESLKQLLLGAPSWDTRKHIKALFKASIAGLPCANYWLRMTRVGRQLYLHTYWLLPPDFELTSVDQLDLIRERIATVIKRDYNYLALDIIFTQDPKWAGPGNALVTTPDTISQ